MRTILQILIFLLPASAMAAGVCEIQSAAAASGDERIYSVQFPDGRKITVVGHLHGDRGVTNRLDEMPQGPDYFARIRAEIQHPLAQEVMKHYREDVEILKKAIREGAKFVGWELNNEAVPAWIQATKELQAKMLSHASRHRVSDPRLISDSTLMMAGAPPFLQLNEPGLMRSIQHVGFEDRQLSLNDRAAYATALAAGKVLAEKAKDDPEFLQTITDATLELSTSIYPHYSPQKANFEAELIADVLPHHPEKYHEGLRELLKAYVAYFKTLHARDSHTAARLVERRESGIHFIGAAHALPIVGRLAEACRAEAGAVRPASINSPAPASALR